MKYLKGKDRSGNPLNEDALHGGVTVLWRNKRYNTGNRRHWHVELLDDSGRLVRIANMAHVTIVEG